MTLQLVTGPTNASKAGVVLGLVRRWAAEGRRPVLVVPTGPDAERYRRELLRVSGGVSVGVTVGTFARLAEDVRRAVDVTAATLGPLARDRLLAGALRAVPAGRPLGGTAGRRGVRRRLDALLEELGERGFGPGQLHADLLALDPAEHGVDGQLVDDLRQVLEAVAASALHLTDGGGRPLATPAAQGLAVRRRLAADPAAWGGRPVAFYGFDDLTFAQLALVRTLSRAADVVVSLPFEDDRIATAARRPVVEELRAVALDVAGRAVGGTGALPLRAGASELEDARVAGVDAHEVRLLPPAVADGGLARLERRLFEPAAADVTVAADTGRAAGSHPLADGSPEDAGARSPDAAADGAADGTELHDVVLVTGGSARAEAEALADELLRVVAAEGLDWHDVAIAVRGAAGPPGARLERELVARGVPVARPRDLPARRTAVGRAVAALVRIGTGGADAADVVCVLRSGATLANLEAIDAFALALSRSGVTDAGAAEVRAHQFVPTLEGRDLLGTVPVDERPLRTERLIAALQPAITTLEELLRSPTLPAARDPELRAARRLREQLRGLEALAAADAALLPDPAELADELGELPVPVGEAPGRGRLEIAEPGALRGRQVQVLALADLREQAFPAPERVDPLVDRDAREVLSRAGGTTIEVPVERLAAERVLFLELAARPTRRLVLSRPAASDTGEALPPAPFLGDALAALLPDRPRAVLHGASEVRAPSRRPVATAAPFGADLDDAGRETVRRVLLERSRFAVREVERLARCPVCWTVEHLARAQDDEPQTEPQVHGNLVHGVLDRALVEVAGDGTPYGDLDPEVLVAAGRRALTALGPRAVAMLPEHRASVLLRRVDVGVSAVLRALPDRYATASLRATEVVVDDGADTPPVQLGDGARAIGRIDRVDEVPLPDGSTGVGVVDYKLGTGGAIGCGRWSSTATLQAALYLSAVAEPARPAAYALYQPTSPVSGVDPGARPPAGLELRGVLGGRTRGPKELDEVAAIVEAARRQAARAVADLRAGGVTPLPGASTHADTGECDHPAVARLLT
ncbi:PD-(D/E)XK nuclease family protein [Patulibacter americanus]|uniref:PD-(D/E)XK nuclease family protein n=1 Tax=Patulibacter americanus TaxID=588672 RepID=UPI0003B4A818|nr:PD-(D/E)XK nuclease family protein [Patulibacter americanus]